MCLPSTIKLQLKRRKNKKTKIVNSEEWKQKRCQKQSSCQTRNLAKMCNKKIVKVFLLLLAAAAIQVQGKHQQQLGYRRNRNSGKSFFLFNYGNQCQFVLSLSSHVISHSRASSELSSCESFLLHLSPT